MTAALVEAPSRALTFQQEPLDEGLWYEIYPLLEKHWEEISFFKDIPLDPDIEMYAKLHSAGILRLFTLRREKSGELVGYAAFFITRHPHYRTLRQAQQDVIYVDPAARGMTGYRFIKQCDAALKAEGVQVVFHHVKAAHNFGPMLVRLGYSLVDLIYTRRLD